MTSYSDQSHSIKCRSLAGGDFVPLISLLQEQNRIPSVGKTKRLSVSGEAFVKDSLD